MVHWEQAGEAGKIERISKQTNGMLGLRRQLRVERPGSGVLRREGWANFDRDSAQAIDRLEEALREIAEHYDFLVLDCPPNLGLLFTAALKAAQHVIVPISAQYLLLEGVGDLLQSLDEMLMRRKLSILGTLIT
jgi:cellulose biosynthesis protein BcsQ